MPNYRHLVTLPMISGLPGDVAVNVWHSISDDDAEAIGFANQLVTFYQAVDNIFSTQLSEAANACSVTTYDLSDPTPRVPVDETTFTISPAVDSAIPNECAICLSFQGIQISGLPQARRRGRVFLGPLGSVLSTAIDGRVNAATVTLIVNAAQALLDASGDPGIGVWAVYSPTNDNTVPVQNGWVDNEFDTIRERGRVATTRSTFST